MTAFGDNEGALSLEELALFPQPKEKTPVTDTKSDTDFLRAAAKYFENRPTEGEDRAHWSNVYNAKNCRDIADRLAALNQSTQADKLVEALEAIGENNWKDQSRARHVARQALKEHQEASK